MNFIREVKEGSDIVKVAELYGLKLNRAYKCVCPFHKERTASFSISPQKQIWKCFGCGKGGDVISLVSELLNINALESAKSINKTLGLGLEADKPVNYFEVNKYKNTGYELSLFDVVCPANFFKISWKFSIGLNENPHFSDITPCIFKISSEGYLLHIDGLNLWIVHILCSLRNLLHLKTSPFLSLSIISRKV